MPVAVDLSTQQAADLLNVSHSYLIGLLDAGAISAPNSGRVVRAHPGMDVTQFHEVQLTHLP